MSLNRDTHKLLVESITDARQEPFLLTEEETTFITEQYVSFLREHYTEEELQNLTEEELHELFGKFLSAIKMDPVSRFNRDVQRQKTSDPNIQRGLLGKGHHLQQLAGLGGLAAGGKVNPDDARLFGKLQKEYQASVAQRTKGLGGLMAGVKGALTGRTREQVISAADAKKVRALRQAGAISGRDLADRYRRGTKTNTERLRSQQTQPASDATSDDTTSTQTDPQPDDTTSTQTDLRTQINQNARRSPPREDVAGRIRAEVAARKQEDKETEGIVDDIVPNIPSTSNRRTRPAVGDATQAGSSRRNRSLIGRDQGRVNPAAAGEEKSISRTVARRGQSPQTITTGDISIKGKVITPDGDIAGQNVNRPQRESPSQRARRLARLPADERRAEAAAFADSVIARRERGEIDRSDLERPRADAQAASNEGGRRGGRGGRGGRRRRGGRGRGRGRR